MERKEPNFAAIILAGGKGTRMGDNSRHKCTFEVAGKPSIIHLMQSLRECKFSTNIIVVGALSNQNME